MNKFSFLEKRKEIINWIENSDNLLKLKKRLKKEIPNNYRDGFYQTWVFKHLLTRLKIKDAAPTIPSPLTVKVSPTMRCNLKCKGCFADNYPLENDLPLNTLERIISQAAALGIPSLGILGGEPLLKPEVLEIFKKFRDIGFYLVTNGILLVDKIISAIQALPHVITIVSIEGFEETNDSLRGKGVFKKIMSAMEKMREAKLIFGFSTTVHKENLEEVISETYIDFMIANGCFFGGFLPYIPVGSSPRYNLVCNAEEVRKYYQQLDRIIKFKPIIVLKEGYSDGTFLNKGCGAGHTIHITSEGEAEPCNGIEFFTGNIHSSSLEEILMSDFYKDIRNLHPEKGRRCLVITDPEGILNVVKKHKAKPTHIQALEHLEKYAQIWRKRNENSLEGHSDSSDLIF